MGRFNRFGASYSQVLALYPGTVLADFDAGGTAGQAKIEAVMDRTTREVASALTPAVYRQMTQVDAEEVVRYATSGQTTATLGLYPITAGTVHLWEYPNVEIYANSEAGMGEGAEWLYRKPIRGLNELTGYAVDATTGGITSLSMSLGSRLFASYDLNNDGATFSLPSVADMMLLGVAAECGTWLYSEGNQEWKAVTEYRDRYNKWLEAIRAGEWIPDELRKLSFWEDIERKSGEVTSVRVYRG